MAKHKPPVIQRMLDRCEVCGRKTHRKDLVLQSQEQLDLQGINLFPYSSYNTNGWDCTAVDAGQISYGTGVAAYMNTPSLGTTIEQPSMIGGTQTWNGSGVILSKTPVDASAFEDICVSAQIGVYEGSSIPDISIVTGLCDAGGNTLEPIRTWTFVGSHRRIWFTIPKEDITSTSSALYVYFSVTCLGKWWADEFQIEDSGKPGTFIETSGAGKTVEADTRIYAGKKVCKECKRKKWELNPGVTKPEQADRWETWGL